MAKKQTRRSISFSRADYEAAQEAARRLEIPLAQLAADALHEYLERRSAIGRSMRNPIIGTATTLPISGAPVAGHTTVLPAMNDGIRPGDDIHTEVRNGVAWAERAWPGEVANAGGPAICFARPDDYIRVGDATYHVSDRPRDQADARPPNIDELIDLSSVGAGLRNIRENGIDAELVALDADLRAAESSGADVQVMYDEDVQAKRAAAAARRKR